MNDADYARHYAETQRRYNGDKDALLAERSWACPYCGRRVEPQVQPHPFLPDKVFILPRECCGCKGELDALAERAEQEEQERRSRASLDWQLKLTRAGLVGWLATATFSTYVTDTPERVAQKQQASDYCQRMMRGELGDKPWLVMHGPYGTGKSHCAAAILQNAIAKGKSARFRVWPQWLSELMASFGRYDLDTDALQRELQSGDVVAIDDVDKQHPTTSGFAEEKLFNALNWRYNAGKPTVLTFNHAPGEMSPWLGEATVDRVLELSTVVEFVGTSWRSHIEWKGEE